MSDITRKRGDTYPEAWTLSDTDTGLPLDITGYTFTLAVDPSKTPADDTTNLFVLVGSIVDAPSGRVEFPMLDAQADHVGTYYFDAQLVDPGGKRRTFDAGRWKFVQDITKT